VHDQKADAKRVIRGGSWNNKARNCRSACRNRNHPDNRNNNLGLRPARAHDQAGVPGPEQILRPAIDS
jgi:formylglycine-generating enzyme required for sulfatase activity